MKFLITACFFSLIFATCQNKPQEDPSNTTTAPPTQLPQTEGITTTTMVVDTMTGRPVMGEKPIQALSSAIGDNPKRIVDEIAPVLIPPNPTTAQEQRVHRVLTTELWAVWSLIRIKKVKETRANQGAWYKFSPDGTYEYGFWDEPISTGTWSFEGDKGLLNLDSKLKGDDRQWKVQMASSEDVMVWVGTERFHTTDISLKLERFANVPKTRAELGVTE